MAANVDPNKCAGCATCVDVCPLGIISINADSHCAELDVDSCVSCGTCADVCPINAITID